MRGNPMRQLALIGTAILLMWLALGCGQTQTVDRPEDFYRGKAIDWVVSSSAGGPTDLLARLVAPYLAKETGAAVRVEAVGSQEGKNLVYNQSKRDGLTLVHHNTLGYIASDVLKSPGVQYETEKFNFVSDIQPSGKSFQISPNLPYRTLEELRRAKGLRGTGTTAKGSQALSAVMMFEILGLDGKVITGFDGNKGMVMALSRGEADIIVSSDAAGQQAEKDGNVVNLMVLGEKRSRSLPNVPTISELGVKVPKEMDVMFRFIMVDGSAVALPPDVPQDRIEYLRKVFVKLSDDKELQQEMLKLSGDWNPFLTGKELQDHMVAIKANKGLADQLDTIFAKYSAVK
ncbi:MAG: hypothetical protein HYY30_00835 [Chloroflexi bacterium]|nr:hypothetical protein [Chloroflexota bacterium]